MTKFEVDIANPTAIAEAHLQLNREIEAMQRAIREKMALRDRLGLLLGRPQTPPQRTEPTAQELVVAAVEDAGRPIRAAEIRTMIDSKFPANTISWAMWKASTDGQIQRLSQGLYAPKNYQGPANLLALAAASEKE